MSEGTATEIHDLHVLFMVVILETNVLCYEKRMPITCSDGIIQKSPPHRGYIG